MDYRSKLVLGVDVAGRKGTTYCLASVSSSGIKVESLPCNAGLCDIKALRKKLLAAVAIDAQLSWDSLNDTGRRRCDNELRTWLKSQGFSQNWVQGIFNLQAVPVKGRLIFEFFKESGVPVVETHPRVDLVRLLGSRGYRHVKDYKGRKASTTTHQKARKALATLLEDAGVSGMPDNKKELADDQIDAAVCAYLAADYAFHILDRTCQLDLSDCTHKLAEFVVFKSD